MGTSQSCCGSKKKSIDDHSIQNQKFSEVSLPNLSDSVPHILKAGTPAYETVVTPKAAKPNGSVSEKDLLQTFNKPLNTSEPQNYHLLQEGKENQPLLSKTLTTPSLDQDHEHTAPGLTWEHTQSLDPIKVLPAEQDDEVFDRVGNEVIDLSVITEQGGISEILYTQNVQENKTVTKHHQTIHEEHIINDGSNTEQNQSFINNIKHEECNFEKSKSFNMHSKTGHLLVTSPDLQHRSITSDTSGNTGSSYNSNNYNIFDIEFRRHNELIAKGVYNSYSSTYQETVSPLPTIKKDETAVSPEKNFETIKVKAEINGVNDEENCRTFDSNHSTDELTCANNNKLYATVVKGDPNQ